MAQVIAALAAGEMPVIVPDPSACAGVRHPSWPQPQAFRDGRPALGVVRRDDRIGTRKVPALAVPLGRHLVRGHQMPFERLELLSVLQAHDVIWEARLVRRHSRGELRWCCRGCACPGTSQCLVRDYGV